MVVEYAHALKKSTTGATKQQLTKRFDAFLELLKNEGKLKALPAILKELQRLDEQEQAQAPTLYVASKKAETRAKRELKEALEEKSTPTVATDETLIGGWRFVGGDTLVDRSYKTALIKLYRNITKA